jgi:hypothetical protein
MIDEIKKYSVNATEAEWNNLLTVIDQSDAPAKQRNAARDMVLRQVTAQLEKDLAPKVPSQK